MPNSSSIPLIPKMPIFRPRQFLFFITTFIITLTVLSFFETPRTQLKRNLPSSTKWFLDYSSNHYLSSQSAITTPEPEPEQEPVNPLEVLSQLYEDERLSLLSEYNQDHIEQLVKSPSGSLDADFNVYIDRLEGFIETYFNGSIYYQHLRSSLERLTNATPQSKDEERKFEKVVYSFDKHGKDGVPPEYEWWNKRLGNEIEGWEIKVGDDEDMESWFEESAGGLSQFDEEKIQGFEMWKEMWDGLGRPVLKSDLLRYLMMLTKGGLYTDSDTAPLSHPDLWGTNANILTPQALTSLQRAMHHLDPKHEHTGSDLELDISEKVNARKGVNNPKVNLVVSVEYDLNHPRQDPRFGYTRDLQIVQWTFMAKPFHPIFMDVLETATTEIMDRRANGEDHDNWQSVLDVTGPGPFTDAVLRYLLVQYGVTPDQLMGMEDGALIGDVLILPLHAFGSFPGGEEDWNGEDPSTRCTAHGFRGRWKGDISFERRSMRWR